MQHIPIRSIQPSHHAAVAGVDVHVRHLQEVLKGTKREESLHRHEFYFLLVVHRGAGSHEIDFVSYPVSDRSVFFVRPGQAHRLSLEAACTGYLVEFSADYVRRLNGLPKELLRRASRHSVVHPEPVDFERICGTIGSIIIEQETPTLGTQSAIDALFSLLMIELARQGSSDADESAGQTAYALERYDELVDLIEQHLTQQKLTSDYARMMHMSSYQVNALTKSLTGNTCSVLINEHIITEAKRHLLATTEQVKEIAYHLGYDDPSYFIRYFKKHTGVSPEVFRRDYR
ncbi:helix-turn-helix domain-containing protein [soil metagenome]